MDLTQLTAVEAARRIADGALSSVELTQACLDRIAARNAEIGAFCHVDPAYSLAQAAQADRDTPRSALHGVPFAVKDVIDTRDFPTERGTVIHRGRRPATDARCVTLMREAGAVLLGKCVTTEYALFTPNETRHPWNTAHTPGGSSSGSAAAVCDRMVPLAFGNQTAGSLIRPAAYCGIYGLKPTHGATDNDGIMPLQPYFDTLGYMARSVADLQAFFAIVSGRRGIANRDPDRQPSIGLCRTFQWEDAETDSRAALFETAHRLRARGVRVEECALPAEFADLVAVHRRILYAGIARSLAADYAAARDEMSDALVAIIEEGRAVDDAAYRDAKAFAGRCRESVNACFGNFDALICPSAPGEAPAGTATGSPVFQVTWTLLGVPCVNLPVATGGNGLPLGVQLVGRRHDDERLLALAQSLMAGFDSFVVGATSA